nr:hypothetical protein [Nocardioides ungokensis]
MTGAPQGEGASPKTTTFATGRTTGPPYLAFGEARRNQAVIADIGSSHTSSQRGEACQPHTPNAAIASSSSTKTSESTNHPKIATRT